MIDLCVEDLGSSSAARRILKERWPITRNINSELADYIKGIIDEVRRRGDAALVDFTMKFDYVELSPDLLKIKRREIEEAYEKVDGEQISAIEFAKDRVEAVERKILKQLDFEYESGGVKIHSLTRPLRSVGCYVPGGKAAYPSSLIMTVVPAKVAGVHRVVVCSPPKRGGEINHLMLVAADICGVDEIFRVGGAQAVAALAYGTETLEPVEKIVGPGSMYVSTAKMLVSQDVPIGLPAGPSEVVILADESAEPRLVALDMLSQAEHGADGASILVTTSRNLAEAVVETFREKIPSSPNRETLVQASGNLFVLVSEDLDLAVNFVNEFAPEHLEVMTEDPWSIVDRITSAGLILIGGYTPVSASDYCLGTNHVLPTGGYSHVFSGLSVLDFVKRVNVVECSKAGLSKVKRAMRILAEAEGLMNHALAVEGRFQDE